ncbi:hypothetical protein Tco_1557280 [Tanacetum coccineum]
MSTLVFVDPEISTQADGAQSSRVPVPLPEDPYEAIRQAYLVGTDTESKPSKAPKSPHTVAPPTSLLDSTSPTLVPVLCRIVCMVVRVPPVMSLGFSASIAEVAAMSDSVFRKRFRSSYESSPSSLPRDLPSQKHYRGTEEDDREEDEEMEESSDYDSVSEDAKDDGPTAEDAYPAAGDKGLATGDEGPSIGVESLSLGGDEAVPGGQQRASPVAETFVGEPLGLGYGALRRHKIALGEGRMPSVFEVGQSSGSVPESMRPKIPPPAPHAQTPPSPEWSSGSLPISPAPSIVSLPISSPMIPLTVPSHVALPATT